MKYQHNGSDKTNLSDHEINALLIRTIMSSIFYEEKKLSIRDVSQCNINKGIIVEVVSRVMLKI